MNFSDVFFKKKNFILLTLPMAGFLWLSISSISQSISTTKEMSVLTRLTKLSVVYSELVHELQKERGMTAGFIGSKGKNFGTKLRSQREETNNKIAQRTSHWGNNEFNRAEIQQLNDTINQSLNELETIRRQVDSQSIKLAQAITYYTQLNAKLLSVAGLNAEISSDATITKETIAYYNFLQGKERAGIERAGLSSVFAKDEFSAGMLVKFITLVTEQDTYFANFNIFANAQSKGFFAQQLNNSSVKEVFRLREIAKTRTAQFKVDAEYWFAQSTGRIAQLRNTENKLSTELLKLAQSTRHSAFSSMILNIIFSTLLIFIAVVISAWKATERKLRFFADCEPLTGLSNRRSFIEQLESKLATANDHRLLSVVFIDLDQFKAINDIYGHETGDLLLVEVANRLSREINEHDVLCRYGGDEFTLLLPQTSTAQTQLVVKKIQRCFGQLFRLEAHIVDVTASIGVAIYPDAGTSAKLLLRHANHAMHAAKSAGRNGISFHDTESQQRYQHKLELKERLKIALEQDQLTVFYQPVVNIESNQIAKFEALVRWPDGDGYISPAEFIPIGEQFGLIHRIGNFVLKQACTDLKALHLQGFNHISFSINRSISEFFHGELEQQSIATAIKAAGLPYGAIVVEITESTAMSENRYAKQALAQLKRKGIKIALDDFCTGYSSLNYLIDYEVDIIKIDRSFVNAIGHDKNSQILTATVIDLAAKLGIEVIAEGVETDQQLAYLRQAGCRYIQGFYYSPALPFADCLALMREDVGGAIGDRIASCVAC